MRKSKFSESQIVAILKEGEIAISLPFRNSSSGALASPSCSSSGLMNSRDSILTHLCSRTPSSIVRGQ